MKMHEKVKILREEKKFSQEYISHQMGLNQSQYSRRETGEIKFTSDEIIQLAKLLQTSISNLFEEETNSFIVHSQNGGNFGQYASVSEKLIEQYEARIKEKDDMIQLLLKNRDK